jgi:hypothetical protein
MGDRLPPLLTVEEAAKVLRIGRTKAYALAQEWRDTAGKSGLPVIDFGRVLRVPLCQLEVIVGGPLADVEQPVARTDLVVGQPATDRTAVPGARARTSRRQTRRSTKSDNGEANGQLSLIEVERPD